MIDKTNWTAGNLMWIAGLLEGEGCFLAVTDKRVKYLPTVSLYVACAMTDEDVIRKLHKLAGFGTVTTYMPRKTNRKRVWKWKSEVSPDVYEFEIAILPYMGERRSMDIIRTHELRRDYERKSDEISHPSRRNLRRVFTDSSGRLLSDSACIPV